MDPAEELERESQGTDDPSELGDGSQEQPQASGTEDPGSPPIEDPGTGEEPWATIDPKEPGPPRRDHERALFNARRQAAEEALGGRERDDVQRALAFHDMSQDPQALLAWMFTNYPDVAQALMPRQPEPQGQHPEPLNLPQPVLDQYTGQYFYRSEDIDKLVGSRVQAALEAAKQEFQQQLQPLQQQQHHTQETQAADAQLQVYINTLPGFQELLDDGTLTKELQRDGRATVLSAYNKAFKSVYEPRRRAQERSELLKSLQGKAGAQNEGRPRGGGVTKPRSPQDFQRMGNAGFDAAFEEAEAEAAAQG